MVFHESAKEPTRSLLKIVETSIANMEGLWEVSFHKRPIDLGAEKWWT